MLTRFKVSVFARPVGTTGAFRRYSACVDAFSAIEAESAAIRALPDHLSTSPIRDVDVAEMGDLK